MLTNIYIIHFATITELSLELTSGTTVITGETGAGKSILLDAIELALGKRATDNLVYPGKDRADISLNFNIQQLPQVQHWLEHAEIASGDECIVRRSLTKDGKSRNFINGIPTTLQALRELAELLIDIHGQHEHQSLLKKEVQTQLLDTYAGHIGLTNNVRDIAREWHKTQDNLAKLRLTAKEQTARSEFLHFQLNDISSLNLADNELPTLEQDHKQLTHADELLAQITQTLNLLSEDETHSVVSALHTALRNLEQAVKFDKRLQATAELLNSAIIQTEEAVGELRHYHETVESDPERLQKMEERLRAIFDMARKYKVTPQALPELQQRLTDEIRQLANNDEQITLLEKQLTTLTEQYLNKAALLSKKRQTAAKRLAQEITLKVQELGMPHAKFSIQIENLPETSFNANGLEKIEFWVTTNPGLPLQPLQKVASGGELSRISLAIHVATAQQYSCPTLIFDEVDVGISGGIAEIVGDQLRQLGNTYQVLCVTHLPQVAAKGHQHCFVEKIQDKTKTETKIKLLNQTEKIAEIARMLGGVKVTQKTLDHAREMVEEG